VCRTPRPNPDVITFSHAKHAENAIACTDCHAAVPTQTALPKVVDAPKMAQCGTCHELKPGCVKCHPQNAAPQTYARWTPPAGQLRFGHQAHAARTKGACGPCHAPVEKTVRLSQLRRPGHSECFSCHVHADDYRRMACDRCHTNLRQYPVKAVALFNHEGDWLAGHPPFARSNAGVCRQCHVERYCDDCHSRHNELIPSVRFPEQVARQFIHRGDWLTRHGLDMAATPGSCLRCHAEKQCLDCHRVEGVGQLAPSGSATNRPSARPHPTTWMTPVAPDFHGVAARRNIVACAGCHDRGASSNCVLCHRVGGAGGNPHPGGRPAGRASERNTNPMCRICHL
jgi:hypothetical protein